MAAGYFTKGKLEIIKQTIDLENDTIKIAKMASAYTPDVDNHQFYSDISASVVGTDQTLASVAATKNDTDNAADVDATDPTTQNNQTITFDMVVYYKDTGVASTSPLIAYADIIEGELTPVDGDIDLTFNARGFLAW